MTGGLERNQLWWSVKKDSSDETMNSWPIDSIPGKTLAASARPAAEASLPEQLAKGRPGNLNSREP